MVTGLTKWGSHLFDELCYQFRSTNVLHVDHYYLSMHQQGIFSPWPKQFDWRDTHLDGTENHRTVGMLELRHDSLADMFALLVVRRFVSPQSI